LVYSIWFANIAKMVINWMTCFKFGELWAGSKSLYCVSV